MACFSGCLHDCCHFSVGVVPLHVLNKESQVCGIVTLLFYIQTCSEDQLSPNTSMPCMRTWFPQVDGGNGRVAFSDSVPKSPEIKDPARSKPGPSGRRADAYLQRCRLLRVVIVACGSTCKPSDKEVSNKWDAGRAPWGS